MMIFSLFASEKWSARAQPKFVFPQLLVILAFLLSASVAASGTTAATATAALSASATAKGPILVGCEIDYPPFCVVKANGQPDGFSVELLQAVLQAMGQDVAFRTGPWSHVKGWLETGGVQVLPLVGRTPEREPVFDFTFPYMTLHGAIVIREGTTGIQELGDLKGRKVAVMKGDNAEEFLRRSSPGCEIRTTSTFSDALRELSQGKHDAVVMQRLLALRLLQESGLPNLRLIQKPVTGFRQDFCFAVKEGDKATLEMLNEGLALVMANGTYRRLHHKWLGSVDLPSKRRIIVGGDRHYPPWEFRDEHGEPTGYNVELTRAIARELGLDIEIRLGDWSDMVKALENGEIDVLQGMFYTPERDQKFDFSPAHTVNHCVSVVRQGEGEPPGTLGDLKGKRIVVERGDLMHELALQQGLEKQVTAVDSQETALEELAAGKHDCALVARLTGLYFLKKQGWTNLVIGRKPFVSQEYCYAVRNQQLELLTQFREGLRILEKSGEYHRIQEKWLGVQDEESRTLSAIGRFMAWATIPLLLILLLSVAWTRTLRRQVALRTAELRESETKHRLLFETMVQGVVYQNADGTIFSVNPAAERILGLSQDQLMGKTSADPGWKTIREDGSDFPGSEHPAMIALRTGQPVGPCTMGVYNPISQKRSWLLVNATPLFLPGQTVPHQAYATMEDISELRRAREEYQTLFRLMLNGFALHEIICDLGGKPVDYRFLAVNPAFESMTGLKASEVIGQTARTIMPHLEFSWVEIYGRVALTGEPAFFENFAREQGKYFEVTAFRPAPGQFACLFSDISERKKAEEDRKKLQDQLLQAQKMESIGRLAGGIAHDFNNMLSVILGRVEGLLSDLEPEQPLHHELSEIQKAAEHSAALTRQLLAFARKQVATPKVIDLNETIEGMLRVLRRLIGEDMTLTWKPSLQLWSVKIDPVQIDQILANLCLNARDAVAAGGAIRIETAMVKLEQVPGSFMQDVIPGEYVRLSVSDNGRGMDRKTLENLFEPFFTTKEFGKGTGLGLAMVYGIVKQNHGYIDVLSEVGKGTTFQVFLPRESGNVLVAGNEMQAGRTASGKETILLVEDEPSLLELSRIMLEKQGYAVLAASTPGEAVGLAEKHAGAIRLLLTDVVMPEMNGRDLARKVLSHAPGMKCLFMSGYTADVIAEHGVLEENVAFLHKPFPMRTLMAKIREVLDKS